MVRKLLYTTFVLLCFTVLAHGQPSLTGGLGVDYSTQEDSVTNLRLTLNDTYFHSDIDIHNDGVDLKRTYLKYSPLPEVELRVGNIRKYSGIAAEQGYASQWFVSQVDGFTRSHKPGIAAVGSFNSVGYQFAYFEDESFLGRFLAEISPNLAVGTHYYSEDDRFGFELSAEVDQIALQAEYLPSTEYWYTQVMFSPEELPGFGYRLAMNEETSHAVVVTHNIGAIDLAVEHGWTEDEDITLVSALYRF